MILDFLNSWQFVLLFYLSLCLLIYKNKSRFEFQGKIIALYKTKLGISAMKRIAKKHNKLVKRLSYVGVIVGYLGMLLIVYYIFLGVYNLIFVPEAPATLAPVIPGVKIPGSPVFVPFWYGMLSLFIVIVIHEFSHGVVSKAYNIPIKSSGFVLFGPLPGAFVEPDEKKLGKMPPYVQNSLFAAGPFSNILTALLVVVLFVLVISPIFASSFSPVGFSFSKIEHGFPAELAGLEKGVIYDSVNGEEVTDASAFLATFASLKPSETVSIGKGDDVYEVVAVEHPKNPERGYIGVNIITRFANEGPFLIFMKVIIEILNWIFMLSLGLGLANLLPIGPVDGGRMFRLACHKFLGSKNGDTVWIKTSTAFFVLIILLVFVPIFKAVL